MFSGLIPGLNSVNSLDNDVPVQNPAILTSLLNLPRQNFLSIKAFSETYATLFTQSLDFFQRDWSDRRSFVLLVYFCIFIPIVLIALSSEEGERDGGGGDAVAEEDGEPTEDDNSLGLMSVFRNEPWERDGPDGGVGDTVAEVDGESTENDYSPGLLRVFRNALCNAYGHIFLRESYDPSRSFCGICFEEKQNWRMFRSENCSHSFCYDCTSKHVEAKVLNNITLICCPGIDCKAELGFEACRNIVSKDIIARWDKCLCVSLIPESQRVYCPFKDCSAMLVNDTGKAIGKTECPACRRLICAKCRVPWHTEFTCKEFERIGVEGEGRDDLLVEELAKKKSWRKCPNCKMCVEKSEGCLHITCRCGFEFCYMCGSRWDKSHVGCRRGQESETSQNLPSPLPPPPPPIPFPTGSDFVSPPPPPFPIGSDFVSLTNPTGLPYVVLEDIEGEIFRRPLLSSYLSLSRP